MLFAAPTVSIYGPVLLWQQSAKFCSLLTFTVSLVGLQLVSGPALALVRANEIDTLVLTAVSIQAFVHI